MARWHPYGILDGGGDRSSYTTLMGLLGTLSFTLRVLVEIIRIRRRRKPGADGACPLCGCVPSPADASK